MNNPDNRGPASGQASRQGAEEQRPRSETESASTAANQAVDTAFQEAQVLGEEARGFAEGQAEKVKDATAAHMEAFADALNAASAELSKGHSGPAAEMVSHAASGLESLSRSLHGKSTADLLDSVRQFGRQNPVGFVAGSVLAGFALSRFAVAGTASQESSPGGTSSGSAARQSPPAQASPTTAPSSQEGSKR